MENKQDEAVELFEQLTPEAQDLILALLEELLSQRQSPLDDQA